MSGAGPDDAATYDLIGVGFGPSNLALAIAAVEEEEEGGRPLNRIFLERNECFGWHRGMLIDEATMQVAFLKDLVTLRNPVSQFGFVPYLWAKGRLAAFINHKTLFPTRVEFHDYLEWAAARVTDAVQYSAAVVNVRPVSRAGQVTHVDVMAHGTGGGGQLVARRTRNIVLAPGLQPAMPVGVECSAQVWHSSELLSRTSTLDIGKPHRFVVVGAGQSAAEVAAYLHSTFRDAEVHAVHSRYGYSPSDDSPFANMIFDPTAVDEYFTAPDPVKRRFFDYHSNTNYSAVDVELLQSLYAQVYRERVTGRRRLLVHHLSQVESQHTTQQGVEISLTYLPTGGVTSLVADHLVYATGYRPVDPETILGDASPLCERDALGRLKVERDYRVVTRPGVHCGIYLQGGTEHSHGISSSLLSNVAVRAGEILSSIRRHQGSAGQEGAQIGEAHGGGAQSRSGRMTAAAAVGGGGRRGA